MKRAILVAAIGFLVLTQSQPTKAQIPARGLSALVCLAGIDGNGDYEVSGQLVVHVSDDQNSNDSTATLYIEHGGDDSTHQVTYSDTNEDGKLNCGDIVLTVS